MRTIRPGSFETAEMFKCAFIYYKPDILGIPGFEHSDGSIELFCGDPSQRLYLLAPALDIINDIRAREAARG